MIPKDNGDAIVGPFNKLDVAAIAVSLFIPGIGHAILGQNGKAVAYFTTLALCVALLFCGCLPLILPIMLIPPLAIVDTIAVARARKLRSVGPWEFLPEIV